MENLPADDDPHWTAKALDALNPLVHETAEAIENWEYSVRYGDGGVAPPRPPVAEQVVRLREVLDRLLKREGGETAVRALERLESVFSPSAFVRALCATGHVPVVYEFVRNGTFEQTLAAADLLRFFPSNEGRLSTAMYDAPEPVWNEIFEPLARCAREAASDDKKRSEALIALTGAIVWNSKHGVDAAITLGFPLFAESLKKPDASLELLDAAVTGFSDILGWRGNFVAHLALDLQDAVHKADIYHRLVQILEEGDHDGDRRNVILQVLVALQRLVRDPDEQLLELDKDRALASLQVRRDALVDAGVIPAIRRIAVRPNGFVQASDVLASLAAGREAAAFEGMDAHLFRTLLYANRTYKDSSAVIRLFNVFIQDAVRRKACAERGCHIPLRHHLDAHMNHLEAGKALALLADVDGIDIWHDQLVMSLSRMAASDADESAVLGLKLIARVIKDDADGSRRRAFLDVGLAPIVRYQISKTPAESPGLAEAASAVYKVLRPECLELVGDGFLTAVETLLSAKEETIKTAANDTVLLLLAPSLRHLLLPEEVQELQTLLDTNAGSHDLSVTTESSQRQLAHAIFVPLCAGTSRQQEAALTLAAVFLTETGTDASTRAAAFWSGGTLFIPPLFIGMEPPQANFEKVFPTFPDDLPRDAELPDEEEWLPSSSGTADLISEHHADADQGDLEVPGDEELLKIWNMEKGGRAENVEVPQDNEISGCEGDALDDSNKDVDEEVVVWGRDVENGIKAIQNDDIEDCQGQEVESSASEDAESDYELSEEALDLAIAIRTKLLQGGDGHAFMRDAMLLDLLSSPYEAVVAATLAQWSNLYLNLMKSGPQRAPIPADGLVPMVCPLDLCDNLRPKAPATALDLTDDKRPVWLRNEICHHDLLSLLVPFIEADDRERLYSKVWAPEFIRALC